MIEGDNIPPVAPDTVSPSPLPAAPTTPPTVFVRPPTCEIEVSNYSWAVGSGNSLTVLPKVLVTPFAPLVTPLSSCPKPMMIVDLLVYRGSILLLKFWKDVCRCMVLWKQRSLFNHQIRMETRQQQIPVRLAFQLLDDYAFFAIGTYVLNAVSHSNPRLPQPTVDVIRSGWTALEVCSLVHRCPHGWIWNFERPLRKTRHLAFHCYMAEAEWRHTVALRTSL